MFRKIEERLSLLVSCRFGYSVKGLEQRGDPLLLGVTATFAFRACFASPLVVCFLLLRTPGVTKILVKRARKRDRGKMACGEEQSLQKRSP